MYRLVRRVLHGLVSHCVDLGTWLRDLKGIAQLWRSVVSFDEALAEEMPTIIRDVSQQPATTPILIAADELAKWDDGTKLGEIGKVAIASLRALAFISQTSAIAQMTTKHQAAPTGVIYIVASALSAYNPSKGMTEESNRPVFFLPLPPLDPKRFDDSILAVAEEHDEVYTLLRSTLFASRHNARLLDDSAAALRALSRPVNVASAEAFREKWVEKLEAAAATRVARLAGSQLAVSPTALLGTLFHRTVYDKENSLFHPDMMSALHCDKAGIAAILRDFETGTDSVCMNPWAIHDALTKPHSRPLSAKWNGSSSTVSAPQ